MTTIACGGGPKLEQRRAFAALRDGTHVPGYRGYCPQIKYRVGKTYGTDTHLLAKDTIHRHPSSILAVSQPSAPISNLPDATGDNKYTQSMVPGYTGYIPRMPFKFGNTYKEDCDVCIDQFITARKFSDSKATDLRRQIGGYPRLTSISHDPDVRDKLNMYRDTHPTKPILVEDKRGFVEPPIPGYKGFIPRIKSTEQGLGCRYHRSTQNGLELFVQETAGHAQRHGAAIPQSIQSVAEGSMGFTDSRSAPPGSNRLYKNDGMIPKYTGYIPQRRYNFGNTYGDTTRTLPVCAHNNVNFGDFVRSNTFA